MTDRGGQHRLGQVERLLVVLMAARLGLALGALGIAFVLDSIHVGSSVQNGEGFYATVALCFVAALVYRPFVGRIRHPLRFGAVNVVTDILLVSGLVLFSGGSDSVFTFFYVAVALYGGVLFPGWGALLCAATGSASYGAILWMGAAGWLAPMVAPQPFAALFPLWLAHGAALAGAGALGGFLAREVERAGEALEERTQDLEQLRSLHQRTVESLRSGLLTTDLHGRVTSFNLEAQRITGWARDDAIGRGLDDLLPGIEALRGVTGGFDAMSRPRMEYRSADGNLRHLGFSVYVLRDHEHSAVGEVVIFQDVTDVVAMEQDLRRSERLAAAGELSASIAHEIRNPLAAISGSIQMMRGNRSTKSAGMSAAETRSLMDIVVREVDRLDGLISDFLLFARPSSFGIEAIDLHEMFAAVLEVFEGSRPENVQIEWEVETGLGVFADPSQLRQVIWNLLLNATQAMPEGGQIRIEAQTWAEGPPQAESDDFRSMNEDKPEWAEIVVRDQGEGISADVAEHMFDPFFTTKPSGSGLGLAIVHRVLEEQGGSVRAGPGGEGFVTALSVRLPRAEISAAQLREGLVS